MPLKQSDNLHYNNNIDEISVEVITILERSLRLILTPYDKLTNRGELISAIALFVSLFIVLITADFKNFIFESTTWFLIFISLTILSLFYIIYIWCNTEKKKFSVDDVMDKIRKEKSSSSKEMRLSNVTKPRPEYNPSRKKKRGGK